MSREFEALYLLFRVYGLGYVEGIWGLRVPRIWGVGVRLCFVQWFQRVSGS